MEVTGNLKLAPEIRGNYSINWPSNLINQTQVIITYKTMVISIYKANYKLLANWGELTTESSIETT